MTPFHRTAGEIPRIWAHRGASAQAPENTSKSFARALDEGADGVELDVRRAGSGEIVVVHDRDLLRVAGADVRVDSVSYARLRAYDVGEGERIPTLAEVLDQVLSRGALVNVELKADGSDRDLLVEGTVDVIRALPLEQRARVMFSTFYPRAWQGLRRALPDVPAAFLFDDEHTGPVRWRIGTRLFGSSGLNPKHDLVTEKRVARWRRRGVIVSAWTVDAPDELRRLARCGVDGVITNDPRAAREAMTV